MSRWLTEELDIQIGEMAYLAQGDYVKKTDNKDATRFLIMKTTKPHSTIPTLVKVVDIEG